MQLVSTKLFISIIGPPDLVAHRCYRILQFPTSMWPLSRSVAILVSDLLDLVSLKDFGMTQYLILFSISISIQEKPSIFLVYGALVNLVSEKHNFSSWLRRELATLTFSFTPGSGSSCIFLNRPISASVFFIFVFPIQLTENKMFNTNCGSDWIRTTVLWCWKRPLCQLSHNNTLAQLYFKPLSLRGRDILGVFLANRLHQFLLDLYQSILMRIAQQQDLANSRLTRSAQLTNSKLTQNSFGILG